MAQYDISSQFFNWFKNLDGSRRINVACQIFASCHPTELRFFATYISDLFILENNRMNDVDSNVYNILNSFVDFEDKHIRCELIMAVSLLHQRNYELSRAIYDALSEYMRIGWIKDALFSEVSTANQIELLLTLVSNHPAFTFSQKVFFDEQTEYFKTKRSEYLMKQKVEHDNEQIRCFKDGAVGSVNAHFPQDELTISTVKRQPDISERSTNFNCHRSNDGGRIKNIKVAGAYLKRIYKIEVSFPSGKRSHIERSSNDIVNYHHWLSEHLEQKLCLPDLPDLEIDATSTEVSLDQIQNLQDYFRKFIKCVPSYMVHDDIALDFFHSENFVRPSHEVLDHPISAGEKAFPDFKQVFKQRNDEKECPVSFKCSEFPASYSPKAKLNALPRKTKLTFYPPISSSSSEETLRKQAPSDCSSCSNSSTGSTEQIKSDYLPKSSAETNGKRYEPNPLTANSVLEAEKKIKNLKVSQSSSERPKSGRKHKREYKKIYLQF